MNIALNKIYKFLLANDDFKYKIKFEENNNIQIINEIIIEHIIDNEPYKNKKILLDYLYFNDTLSDFEVQLKKYFDNQILKMSDSNIEGIWLYNDKTDDPSTLLIKNNISWDIAKMTDRKQFNIIILQKFNDIYNNHLNSIFGYISYIEKNNDYVFKSININGVHKNRGKRCDQAGKTDIIKLINDNEKKLYSSLELCCLQELALRYYTHIKKDNKIWFLNIHDAYLVELKMKHKK